MKLYSIIESIKKICSTVPNVHTVIVGDVYELNQLQDIEYSAVVITEQSHAHNIEEDYNLYGLDIFYVDRETSDKSNILDIHSCGIDVLNSIVNSIEDMGGEITNQYSIITFEERFDSLCAGAYASLNIRFATELCEKPAIVTSVNGMSGDVVLDFPKKSELNQYIKNYLDQNLVNSKVTTMKINQEQKFGVPTNYFSIGTTASGYTLEYSVDGINWTGLKTQTPPNEVHIVSDCPKNLWWRMHGNRDNDVLVQW